MKNIKVVKTFPHCVGDDTHPTTFEAGKTYNVDDRTSEVALGEGWATKSKTKAAGEKPSLPDKTDANTPAGSGGGELDLGKE